MGEARSLRSFPRYADELENECMIRFHPMISLSTPIYITCSRVIAQPVLPRLQQNWNLEVLDFKERGKPEYPEKNLSGRGREPTTNSPTCGVHARIRTGAALVGGESSHHCAIPCCPEATENHLHSPLNRT